MKTMVKIIFIFLISISLMSCSVKYRHQVEAPGTPAHWQYGGGGFMRYDGYRNVAGDLEVATADYNKKGSNITIKLVGAVHIGDKGYFQNIQKTLDKADLVLFEGVKLKGVKSSFKNRKHKRGMYWAMARLIGLTNQMNEIQYNRKNFKHCDVTIDRATLKSMSSLNQMQKVFKIMEKIIPLKRQLSAFIPQKQMEDYMKHTYATSFAKAGSMNFKQMSRKIEPLLRTLQTYKRKFPSNAFINKLEQKLLALKKSYEMMGSFVIDKRNTYVINMLAKELKKLANPKKPYTIAIFYGAAHLSDLGKRMGKMGYVQTKKTWTKAWKINSPK